MNFKFCPKLPPSHYWGVGFRWQRCLLSLEIYFFQESAHSIFFCVILGGIFGFPLQVFWRTLEFTLSARELLHSSSDSRTGWPTFLPVASFPSALTGHVSSTELRNTCQRPLSSHGHVTWLSVPENLSHAHLHIFKPPVPTPCASLCRLLNDSSRLP